MTLTIHQDAGALELLRDPAAALFADAERFAKERFAENGRRLDAELPGFRFGLTFARGAARKGTYRRHEMPVIETEDIPDLMTFLYGKGIEYRTGQARAFQIKPMQCQIYVDKAVGGTAKAGREGTVEFLQANPLVTDKRGRLFDGHHRWLTACTLDPEIILPRFEIIEAMDKIIPDLLAFSDQRHERNA